MIPWVMALLALGLVGCAAEASEMGAGALDGMCPGLLAILFLSAVVGARYG